MVKEGSWFVESKIDPRWDNSGRCFGDSFCVPDMEKWIEKCKKEYGLPPSDATQAFYKD